MPTPLDLLYVALFAVAGPLLDYFVGWPGFRRRIQSDPARARRRLYAEGILVPWAVVAFGAGLWLFQDRSWTALGFSVPDGWRLWVSVVLVVLYAAYTVYTVAAVARDPQLRAALPQQFGKFAEVLPHTRTELYQFAGASLTAGFCEEFLFRGYFIRALAPWLGWWGAAACSLLIFAGGHNYQGWNGVLRTGVVGAIYTLVVATFGSLWPAIALHALVDLGGGLMAWLALREGEVPATAGSHGGSSNVRA